MAHYTKSGIGIQKGVCWCFRSSIYFVCKNSSYLWIIGLWGCNKNDISAYENTQRRIFWAFWKSLWISCRKLWENIIYKQFELFLSQLTSELFRHIREKSPFNFLRTFFIQGNIRRRENGFKPNQCSRTIVELGSLKISILRLYNWLDSANLISYDLKNFSRFQIKNYLTMLNHNYVKDNQDLFHLFYWNTLRFCLSVHFDFWNFG